MKFQVSASLVLVLMTALIANCAAAAPDYQIDVIRPENYPQWSDSWLFDINNRGQATGYVRSTATGDYQPVIYQSGNFETLPVPNGINPQAPLLAFVLPVEAWHNYGFKIAEDGTVLGAFHEVPSNNSAGAFTDTGQLQIAVSTGFLTSHGPERLPYNVGNDFNLASAMGNYSKDIRTNQPIPSIGMDNRHRVVTIPYPYEKVEMHDGATEIDLEFLNSILLPRPDEIFVASFNVHGLSDNGKFVVDTTRLNIDIEADPDVYYLVDVNSRTTNILQFPDGMDVFVSGMDTEGTPVGVAFIGLPSTGTAQAILTWNPDGSIRDTIPAPPGAIQTYARNVHGHIAASTDNGPMFFDGQSWSKIEFVGKDIDISNTATIYDLNDQDQFIGLVFQGDQGYAYIASAVPEPSTMVPTLAVVAGFFHSRRRHRA